MNGYRLENRRTSQVVFGAFCVGLLVALLTVNCASVEQPGPFYPTKANVYMYENFEPINQTQ